MEKVTEHLQSTKTAIGVATTSIGTWISQLLNIIPDDIGKFAALAGGSLSVVLIIIHIKKYRLEQKIRLLEIKQRERDLNKTPDPLSDD